MIVELYFDNGQRINAHVSDAVFKELVQRGANLWPDAPPEIKEFADRVTTGRVQQDYRAQAGKLIPAKLVKGVFEKLVPVPPFPSTVPHQGV